MVSDGRQGPAMARKERLFLGAGLASAVLALAMGGCGSGHSESTASGCKRLAETAVKFSGFATGRDSDLKTFAEEGHDFAVFSFLSIFPDAPAEIRDDLQVLDHAFSKYLDAIGDGDLGQLDQEAIEKLQKPNPWTRSDKQKIRQASQNIAAWAREECLETQ